MNKISNLLPPLDFNKMNYKSDSVITYNKFCKTHPNTQNITIPLWLDQNVKKHGDAVSSNFPLTKNINNTKN